MLRNQRQLYANLRSWVIKEGGYVDLIELANITDGVRKVITRRNIKEGQGVLFIPDKLMITLTKVENESEIVKKVKEIEFHHPINTKFAIWCLEEREKPDSYYSAFLKTFLVNVGNYPLFYSKSEMDLLVGSPVVSMIDSLRENIKEDYVRICSVAPEFSKHTLLEFTKIRTIVNSA